jgi:hypothetical protein
MARRQVAKEDPEQISMSIGRLLERLSETVEVGKKFTSNSLTSKGATDFDR